MNTALGFILPVSSSGGNAVKNYSNLLGLWMRVVSTVCLAVLSRSLQPMFPGLAMFQGYIEWNISSSILKSVQMLSSGTAASAADIGMLTVFCTWLAFYTVDSFYRDVVRKEDAEEAKMLSRKGLLQSAACSDAQRRHMGSMACIPRLSLTFKTLQSITIIMFTNSLVTWSMDVVSGGTTSAGSSSLGTSFATIVAGIVVARTILQIVDASRKVQHPA